MCYGQSYFILRGIFGQELYRIYIYRYSGMVNKILKNNNMLKKIVKCLRIWRYDMEFEQKQAGLSWATLEISFFLWIRVSFFSFRATRGYIYQNWVEFRPTVIDAGLNMFWGHLHYSSGVYGLFPRSLWQLGPNHLCLILCITQNVDNLMKKVS